jgi:hypothetical protein
MAILSAVLKINDPGFIFALYQDLKNKKALQHLSFGEPMWVVLDSNQWPLPCQGNALNQLS